MSSAPIGFKKILPPRVDGLDFARGLAICLMILSHSIVGLVPFSKLVDWQLVPVHLITKLSSSLFFTVFGISLALFYLPHADKPDFYLRQRKLFIRGVEILVWYKVLTFVQMFQIYERKDILDALLFLKFPDFVEVLGFYGIFLLWFPWVMKLWSKIPLFVQPVVVIAVAAAGQYLNQNYDFGGYMPIKAILVEHQGEYTFGQFQRGAVVLFGLFLGSLWRHEKFQDGVYFQGLLAALGFAAIGGFYYLAQADFSQALVRVASNGGKHPPDMMFMTFSMGWAYVVLALCLLLYSIPAILKPFSWLGEKSLQAFVFHIFVIFALYRYLLNLRHNVPYEQAMWLTILLIGTTMIWCLCVKIKDSRGKPNPDKNLSRSQF